MVMGATMAAQPTMKRALKILLHHDVTHGQVGGAVDGRHETDKELGHGGAHGHDGETDDDLGDAHALGQAHGALGEEVGAPQHHGDAHHENDYLQPHLRRRESEEE
jgi:hypothetical protein